VSLERGPRALSVALVVAIIAGRGALWLLDEPEPAVELPDGTLTPALHYRPPDQTYLTFPEWFLVHSPAEYADYVAEESPSGFPFLSHVGQLWSSYAHVTGAIPDEEPINAGYHFMILVIASSTTVEYGLRSLYETLVGRMAEATQTHGRTPEEELGARVARDYVDFIDVRPWYEFDFTTPLVELWAETPLWGPDAIRKWERRYALTSELVAKASYGWLIGLGTAASYEAASPLTAVVVDRLPSSLPDDLDIEVLTRFDDGRVLLTLPRYQAFSDHAAALAESGVRFVEIAGNRGDIVVSALAPAGFAPDAPGTTILFRQPILTEAERERVVFETPVANLAEALLALDRGQARLEHVYDY